MKKRNPLRIIRRKEKKSRKSLTLLLSVFVFGILLSAIALTALGLWLLTLAGVTVDVNGELDLGLIILFMSLISLIMGGVGAFFASRIPLKPVNRIINAMNRLAEGFTVEDFN